MAADLASHGGQGASWIVGARPVDVGAGRTLGPSWVRVADGRIDALTQRAPAALDGWTVDATGLVLAPGLIDSHVHLFLDGGPDPMGTFRAATDAERLAGAVERAHRALLAGITTVRDLGAPPALAWELLALAASGRIAAPHLVLAGAPVTRPGGHCGLFGGEVRDAAEARSLIAGHAAAGARTVKVIASGGGLTPGTRPDRADLPLAVMRAAREVGHDHGLRVTAHAHATAAMERALEAGMDMVEHASFLAPAGRPCVDPELAARMRDAGMAVGPTATGALRTAARYRALGRTHDPDDVATIERLEARLLHVREFHRLGVRIVGGTDAGVTDTPMGLLVDELLGYVRMGLGHLDALRTVTTVAADALGLGRVGEVAVGHAADLVLLAGDPLADVAAYRTPLAVWRSGALVMDQRPVRA